jgi:hypothetical protein
MFFGKKDFGKVSSGSLGQLLDSLAQDRLNRIGPKAAGIVARFDAARKEFSEACMHLAELDVEPYTEDLWNPNVNSIKKQKEIYGNVLIGMSDGISLDAGYSSNEYERYRVILDNIEKGISDILKTNANYKSTLYSYSNHMRGMKRAFTLMESLRDALGAELNNLVADYEIYAKIRSKIYEINSKGDEIKRIESGVRSLENSGIGNDTYRIDKELEEVSSKESEKEALLSAVSKDIGDLINSIGTLTAPLSRAARKYDHSTIGKRSLGDFLSDPSAEIVSGEAYGEFLKLLNDLGRSIETGQIDVKNRQDTLASIAAIRDSDIYSAMVRLEELRTAKTRLENDIRGMERIKEELKNGKGSIARSKREIDAMKIEKERLTESRMALGADIERECLDGYGVRLSITLD